MADNQAVGNGSGIYAGSVLHFLHTTIAHNTGGDGSGIYVNGTVDLVNTILVTHTIGIYVSDGSTAILTSTLWGSGAWANVIDWDGGGTIVTGTVNIWGDPAFADPYNSDYHLKTGSAAIDKGIFAGVTTDLDGHSRLPDYGGLRVDIGAYEAEYQGVIYHAYLPITFKNQ